MKRLIFSFLVLFLIFARTGPASARLLRAVSPLHYAIFLKPDPEARAFQGRVEIIVEVARPTRDIALNAVDLDLQKAVLDGKEEASIEIHRKAETAAFRLKQPMAPGRHRLEIHYRGKIGIHPEGLFQDPYQTPEGKKILLATQLEPTDARRVFPSFDEPALKATFQLTAEIPRNFSAVSNMPLVKEEPLDEKWKRVSFGKTPRMSSYLFVFVAGELEFLEGEAEGVKIRVVTPRGKIASGEYALHTAEKLLKYYNGYFRVKYPLPKLDLIAEPGGFPGAMENWGGILFNERNLLYDPGSSSQSTREAIALILAHEMAHQWFGDLVTLAWWDDTWLNEGFANWMMRKAVDRLYPEWRLWARSRSGTERAMQSDAYRTAVPIVRPVKDEHQARQIFDETTYEKGSSVIRMIETLLGEETFRSGLSAYMRKFQYGNATEADLWKMLQKASGKPIQAMAKGWTRQPGLPLVAISSGCLHGKGTVTVTQSPFALYPNPKPRLWKIPVCLRERGGKPDCFLLEEKSVKKSAACAGLLHTTRTGYFRVKHDPSLFRKLVDQLGTLSDEDRIALVTDTWALVKKGDLSASATLDLLESVSRSGRYLGMEQMLDELQEIADYQQGEPGQTQFEAYVRSLLHPLYTNLGWDEKGGEEEIHTVLRPRILGILGRSGSQEVKNEALARFKAFLNKPESLPPNLRSAVLGLAGRFADRATFDRLHQLGKEAGRTEEKLRYYGAMASALDPALAREVLELSLSDELDPVNATSLVIQVAYNGEHRDLAWEFLKTRWPEFKKKIPEFFLGRFLLAVTSGFSDSRLADDVQSFARKNLPKYAGPDIDKALVRIRFKAAFKKRLLAQVNRSVEKRLTLR